MGDIMSHFAEISGSNNIVTRVIVAEQDYINRIEGTWVQTSYNTRGGVHYGMVSGSYAPDGGTQLRKNYAGKGYTYNTGSDAFIAPQPEPTGSGTWVLNEDSCIWELS
jgi:hypothetical protein